MYSTSSLKYYFRRVDWPAVEFFLNIFSWFRIVAGFLTIKCRDILSLNHSRYNELLILAVVTLFYLSMGQRRGESSILVSDFFTDFHIFVFPNIKNFKLF